MDVRNKAVGRTAPATSCFLNSQTTLGLLKTGNVQSVICWFIQVWDVAQRGAAINIFRLPSLDCGLLEPRSGQNYIWILNTEYKIYWDKYIETIYSFLRIIVRFKGLKYNWIYIGPEKKKKIVMHCTGSTEGPIIDDLQWICNHCRPAVEYQTSPQFSVPTVHTARHKEIRQTTMRASGSLFVPDY